jgi:hypothetical protein
VPDSKSKETPNTMAKGSQGQTHCSKNAHNTQGRQEIENLHHSLILRIDMDWEKLTNT